MNPVPDAARRLLETLREGLPAPFHPRAPGAWRASVASPRGSVAWSQARVPFLRPVAMTPTGSGSSAPGHGPSPSGTLPLVGRAQELGSLEPLLEGPAPSQAAAFLCGESGSGKSRLAAELCARAERRGWTVTKGRAYPVERGVPYALLSDALVPLLRAMDAETLAVLSRGGDADLRHLFPALGSGRHPRRDPSASDPDELKTRLFWSLAEFLKGCAARAPLVVVLEDLEWADASSLELVHFLARQCAGHRVLLLCTYDEAERDSNPSLVKAERSLLALGLARVQHVDPLGVDQVTELVCRTFTVDAQTVAHFAAVLFGWTRGNPFFVEEILKSLASSGALAVHSGAWTGWDARDFHMPPSIRDMVTTSMAAYSQEARATAELVAVIGTRASYPLLARISGLGESALIAALEQLCAHRLLSEHVDGGTVVYDFRHAVVRQTLYQQLGLQRARVLHGAAAEAMEAHWGEAARAHADELAYHFARAGAEHLSDKAVTYLAEAGRLALSRHADREAADYLRGACQALEEAGGLERHAHPVGLLQDLARAHQRLGEYDAAVGAWERALGLAPAGGLAEAELRQCLGLAAFWARRLDEAFAHFARGLAVAGERTSQRVLLLLARSHCHQQLGQGDAARSDASAALEDATALGDRALLARAHRSLALLHVWIGPPAEAERHAREAIALAADVGDPSVAFWAHWGLAALWGMTGDTEAMARGIEEARSFAERLRSPVLRLWTDELAVELAYATGMWDVGISLGEAAIGLARSLNQRTLLPRLLVWTSLFHLGRGDQPRARALVDEACEVSGMHGPGPYDVHLVVPAYIGLAHHLVGIGDYAGAIAAARRGLQIAEGTGYTLWAMHRLLPILGEACLWAGEIDEAEVLGRRLRKQSEALQHRLGLAWADACDAMVRWKRGDPAGGADAMRQAAEALEAIPIIPYAVRVRRQLAGRLAEIGETEAALAELKKVHEVASRLGAELELEKARTQFREIGHRPPPRRSGEGLAGLTARELDIARLVALRRSNKAIGKELGISPRTVSTHLSNVFKKLRVDSRAELGDVIREKGLLEE
jgi:DNA-binding NarL/FixJ family response regulator